MQPHGPNTSTSGLIQSSTQEELLEQFSGWGSDVQAMLKCIEKPSKWYVHGIYPPMRTYVKNKIALIGDAVSFLSFFNM
jgi:salicylate hydroxylase